MAESTAITALAVCLFTEKTAEAVVARSGVVNTQLKQGVNESVSVAKRPLPLGEDRVRAYEIENRALTT
jgi:hypothetical protein